MQVRGLKIKLAISYLTLLLPVISAWSWLDEVARDRFWADHPADFPHSLYVSAWRRARGPSPGPTRVSFSCESEMRKND